MMRPLEELELMNSEVEQEPIVHYSATELFMNPRDYEIKELYSMAWQQFPFAHQQEITEIVMLLAGGEYTFACQAADKLSRFVQF